MHGFVLNIHKITGVKQMTVWWVKDKNIEKFKRAPYIYLAGQSFVFKYLHVLYSDRSIFITSVFVLPKFHGKKDTWTIPICFG